MRKLLYFAIAFLLPITNGPTSADPVRTPSPTKLEAPAGWKGAAPRDEIRPVFSFDYKGGPSGDGAFVIAADERDGLHGWWQKSFSITGGKNYRFQAVRKVHDIPIARRSAAVRIVWQDDAGKPVPTDQPAVSGYLKGWKGTAEPEHPTDKECDARGWTEVSDTYRAPMKATQAVVELHLLWAPP